MSTFEDIKLLVNRFYDKVSKDETIGYIFNEAANVNWDKHLPIMYSFWNSLLFGKADYKGNPMHKHIELNKSIPLTKEHFSSWIHLWKLTVNENFEGQKANEAITKASSIKNIMQAKISQL
ncbi:MAG: group III truncated hemoglobin [Bacteroidia bacterium]|nr:group III truncated hemoglobin [Bacteroidia bacterium]